MNRTQTASRTVLSLATLGGLITGGLIYAGPLDPPAGPVASTYKTLCEVEPRIAMTVTSTPGDADSVLRITQPGSYYLTSDLLGVAGKKGIEIAAANVTIDLRGFSMIGVAGSTDAIGFEDDPFNRITIRNGRITNWGEDGIDLAFGVGITIEDVRVELVGRTGMSVSDLSQIRHCVVYDTGSDGILAESECVVENCTVSGTGDDGIVVVQDSRVSDCMVAACQRAGVSASVACVVARNQCSNVAGAGVVLHASRNRAEANTCTACTIGLKADSGGNLIIKNSCAGNTDVNWDLAAFNTVGPIIQGASAPAVHGNSSAGSGPTDANANFSY